MPSLSNTPINKIHRLRYNLYVRKMAILILAACLSGCQSRLLPDPNDPTRVGPNHAQVVRNNLRWASDAANYRVATGEITQAEADRLVQKKAIELSKQIPDTDLIGPDAWRIGEVLLAARDWRRAEKALAYAAANATTEDRRVNDTLRLAQVEAQLGNVPKAIELARTTFNVRPEDKAPILPAILLSIVPAGEGKGYDADLAKLLEDAVKQHEQVRVDVHTVPGKMFLLAMPKHIKDAYSKAAELFEKSGHSAEAAEAKSHLKPITA